MAMPQGDDWLGLHPGPLPVDEAIRWATLARCGATVSFTGTVRDHSENHDEVTALAYEAWEEQVHPVMAEVAEEARVKWPEVGRVAVLHRTGELRLGEAAVLVVASAPHRGEAFEAARYLIDETKARAPIWKKEIWAEGSEWSTPGSCEAGPSS
ncbi:MAG TPA: molybdenum cofactor biosynthesis protein MoaE [Acidimicrobiales bacterium]|nr:molybdenum cofactor biosynthesis protein MoaE [Acidimicrobiales bacterium]